MAKAYGWAWAIPTNRGWTLCHWAEPSKDRLMNGGMPDPDARMVKVQFVPSTKAGRKLLQGKGYKD